MLARLAALGEEQRGDQVATDDEEHLDAEETAGRESRLVPTDEVVVEREDREHRDRTQPVEAREVSERRLALFRLRGGVGRVCTIQCRVMNCLRADHQRPRHPSGPQDRAMLPSLHA